MHRSDFLAIGDITVDAFIKLSDAWVETDNPERAQELCMRFGEKIPYESLTEVPAVGNAPNASVCAARLGLSATLVSNLGNDARGKECLATLATDGVNTALVRTHQNAHTNYHFVLSYGAERTILVKHQPYPYTLPDMPSARWLYLSSLGANTENYHKEIAEWLARHPDATLAFQPGSFQIALGTEKLQKIYARTEVLVCNKEEARRITSLPPPLAEALPSRGDKKKSLLEEGAERSEVGDVKKVLVALHKLGPKIVCITDGPRGAYLSDGTNAHFMPPYPDPAPPVERTGAGDAFAATLVAYLALGKTPLEALRRAPINSAFVVQKIGAQKGLLSQEQLEQYLTAAPTDYAPQPL